MAVEHTNTPDTRTETADKPRTSEKPPPIPPDRPGAPGQPSRAESRAAAQAPPEKSATKPSDKPSSAPQGKPTSTDLRVPTSPELTPRRASREAAARLQDAPATAPPKASAPVDFSPRRASREAASRPQDATTSRPEREDEGKQPPEATDASKGPRRTSKDAAAPAPRVEAGKPEQDQRSKETPRAREFTEGTASPSKETGRPTEKAERTEPAPDRTPRADDATSRPAQATSGVFDDPAEPAKEPRAAGDAPSSTAPADQQPSPDAPAAADKPQPAPKEATNADTPAKTSGPTDQPSPQPVAANDSPPPAEQPKPMADQPPINTGESNTNVSDQSRDVIDPGKTGPDDAATAEDPAQHADAQPSTDAIGSDAETHEDEGSRPADRQTWVPSEDGRSTRAQDQEPAGLRELEARARAIGERYGVDINYSDRPIRLDYAKLINEAIEVLSEDYPSIFRGLHEIRVQNLSEMRVRRPLVDNHTIAYATPKEVDSPPQGIYLNQRWYADEELFDSKAAGDELSGWVVPKGGSPEGVFYHEFGHHVGRRMLADPVMRKEVERALRDVTGLDFDLTLPKFGWPKQHGAIKRGLSEYGATNPSEMLAEAFVEWKLSPNSRPLAAAVGKIMDKYFKGVNS